MAAPMAELGFDFDDTRGLYEKRISNTVNLQASWPMARRGDHVTDAHRGATEFRSKCKMKLNERKQRQRQNYQHGR